MHIPLEFWRVNVQKQLQSFGEHDFTQFSLDLESHMKPTRRFTRGWGDSWAMDLYQSGDLSTCLTWGRISRSRCPGMLTFIDTI